MRKRDLLEVMVRAVMSLYEGAKTRVGVGLELSEEFEVKVGVHQGSVLSPLVFAIVVDVVTENVRNGLMSKILYVDDLVLTSETMEGWPIVLIIKCNKLIECSAKNINKNYSKTK